MFSGCFSSRRPGLHNQVRSRFSCLVVLAIVMALVMTLLSLLSCMFARGPRTRKLADCTNNVIRVQITTSTSPTYNLLISAPRDRTNALKFGGEVVVREGGQALTIPISSDDITQASSRIQNVDFYLLVWSPTNRSKLKEFMVKGRKYDLVFQFSEMPPPECSLWLRSIGSVCFGSP